MSISFTPFAVGAVTQLHDKTYLESNQFKIEIETSKQRVTLELKQSTQELAQQLEVYMQNESKWFERQQVRQVEMSKDLKELLRREGL